MALKAKGLSFSVHEVLPGLGQVALFKLSGQRQVPVLVDGDHVVVDSSAIIRHLDSLHPDLRLIPEDAKEAAQIHLIEDWADNTLANAVRTALIKAAAENKDLRMALFPKALPNPLRNAIGNFPGHWLSGATEIACQGEYSDLLGSLEQLSCLLASNPWIIGNSMSVADLAVAAQLSLLRFPASSGDELAGKGCLGISDHPKLQPLFQWRDQIEESLRETDPLVI